MLPLISALLFLMFTVPASAQSETVPVLAPVKEDGGSGPFRFAYDGPPHPLSATLTDSSGTALPYKAVLRGTDPGQRYLEFESPNTSLPGMYRIEISYGDTILADESFIRTVTGSRNDAQHKTVRRTTAAAVVPDMTYETVLTYTAVSDGPVTVSEIVPIDALIDAPEASPGVRPELLNLRMPFESNYEKTLPFGEVNPDEHFGIPTHDGIDYALPAGVPVHAVDEGEMVPYREKNSYGITAAIQHTWGNTFYGHLSTVSAQLGTKVRKGDIVGLSGNTGLSSGPHLHFGMMMDGEMTDAARYMSKDNDFSIATKQIQWNYDLKKGQTAEMRYKFSLPVEYESYDAVPFGPIQVTGAHNETIAVEHEVFNTVITNGESDLQKIITDPSYSSTSPLAVRDGVILWIDANDDRILHGFDKITQTTFTQTIDPAKDNSLAIDEKDYTLRIKDGIMTLTQS